MRVLIVGTEEERRALRDQLDTTPPDVVGEYESIVAARAAARPADAILVVARRDPPADHDDAYAETLTPRETEVLELVAEGLSNKAVASRMGISDQTVKFHLASVIGKLGATNRTDAVRRAARRGLVSL